MFAVIGLQGHQYMVKQGDQIVVDTMGLEDGKTFEVDNVLAIFDENATEVKVGMPTIKAKVTCEVVRFQKGEKLKVIKFKRKNRYTRTIGFRQHQNVLEIKKIEVNG